MNRSPLIIHRWFPHPVNADWAYGPGLEKGDFERCVRAIDNKYKGTFGKVGPLIVPGEPTLVLVGERIDDRREVETRGKPMLRLAVLRELPGWEASMAIATALEPKDAEGPGEHDSLFIEWEGETSTVPLVETESPVPEVIHVEPRPRSRRGIVPAVLSGAACLVVGGFLGSNLTGRPAPPPSTPGQVVKTPTSGLEVPPKPTDPVPIIAPPESKDVLARLDDPALATAPPIVPTPVPTPPNPTTAPPTLNLDNPEVYKVRSLARVQEWGELQEKFGQSGVDKGSLNQELAEAYRKARDSLALGEIRRIKDSSETPEVAMASLGEFRQRLNLDPIDPLDEVFTRALEGIALAEIIKEANREPASAIASLGSIQQRLKLTQKELLSDLAARTRDGVAIRKILVEANQSPDLAIAGLKQFRQALRPPKGFPAGDPIERLASGEIIRAYQRAFEQDHQEAIAAKDYRESIRKLGKLAQAYFGEGLAGRSEDLDKYAGLIADRTKSGNLEQQILLSSSVGPQTIVKSVRISLKGEGNHAREFSGVLRKDPSNSPSWTIRVPISLFESSALEVLIDVWKLDPDNRVKEVTYRSAITRWPAGMMEGDLDLFSVAGDEGKPVTLKREAILWPEPPRPVNLFSPNKGKR